MRQILKGYTLAAHKIELAMDNVCSMPLFVVLIDGRELYVGNRVEAVEIFALACCEASKEGTTPKEEIQK